MSRTPTMGQSGRWTPSLIRPSWPTCGEVDIIAQEHLLEIESKLADLEALRRELKGLIEQCGHGTIGECRIIEALSP